MRVVNQDYSTIEETLNYLVDGILVIHQKGSGCFIMLNNLLASLHIERKAKGKEELRVFSINEDHPLYDDFTRNTAVVVVINCQIREILYSPISKNKLLNSIQRLV